MYIEWAFLERGLKKKTLRNKISLIQLIPLFTMDLLGHLHGIPGLVLSCVFSGSLRYAIY